MRRALAQLCGAVAFGFRLAQLVLDGELERACEYALEGEP